MRLTEIDIENYRGIERAKIDDLGSFNVLIGRNNSGKSALMQATHLFFAIISGQCPVNITPPVRPELDHHGGKFDVPISITAWFALSLAERDALVRELIQEFPQMQNAVEGIDPSLTISVTLKIVSHEQVPTAFVSSIQLMPTFSDGAEGACQTLLEITPQLADEMAARLRGILDQAQTAELFQEMHGIISRRPRSNELRYITEFTVQEMAPPNRDLARRWLSTNVRKVSDIETLLRKVAEEIESATLARGTLEERRPTAFMKTYAGESIEIPQYATSLFETISNLKVHYLKENRQQIGRIEAQQLLELKVSRGGPEVLRRIQSTVSDLLGVSIDAFTPSASKRQGPGLQDLAELDVDDFLVEVNGSGIREALRVILDVEFNHPDILLVEEPEVHLHPGLEITLMRHLKNVSGQIQVFIATHSTNFLDTGDLSTINFVSKSPTTKVTRMTIDDAKDAIPTDLGIRLSSLFMYDCLIFVEGPSDELVLRELAFKLQLNLGRQNIGFITLGGSGNLSHYAAMATLEFLTRRQVATHFLIDPDERSSDEITNLKKRMVQHSTLHVLGRRELENYLLDPEALAILLNQRRPESKLTKELVAQELIEIADSLKERLIELRTSHLVCKPIYLRSAGSRNSNGTPIAEINDRITEAIKDLEERRGLLTKAFEEEHQAIEHNWNTRKLHVVPGSLILEELFSRHGSRYYKDRDGASIARIMRMEAVPSDISDILHAVARGG